MLLTTAAFLTAVGFLAFVGGQLGNYPEIAVIGAVLVVGVGAAIADSGLERQTGVVETTNETTNTTVKEFQYQQVPLPTNLPLGSLMAILGGVGVLRALNNAGRQGGSI